MAAGLLLGSVNNIQVTPIIDEIGIMLYKTSKTGVQCGETGVTRSMFIQSCYRLFTPEDYSLSDDGKSIERF